MPHGLPPSLFLGGGGGSMFPAPGTPHFVTLYLCRELFQICLKGRWSHISSVLMWTMCLLEWRPSLTFSSTSRTRKMVQKSNFLRRRLVRPQLPHPTHQGAGDKRNCSWLCWVSMLENHPLWWCWHAWHVQDYSAYRRLTSCVVSLFWSADSIILSPNLFLLGMCVCVCVCGSSWARDSHFTVTFWPATLMHIIILIWECNPQNLHTSLSYLLPLTLSVTFILTGYLN